MVSVPNAIGGISILNRRQISCTVGNWLWGKCSVELLAVIWWDSFRGDTSLP